MDGEFAIKSQEPKYSIREQHLNIWFRNKILIFVYCGHALSFVATHKRETPQQLSHIIKRISKFNTKKKVLENIDLETLRGLLDVPNHDLITNPDVTKFFSILLTL
jgi:hypothetical protein